MSSDKNAICRGCGVSYQKKAGLPGRHCSSECKIRYPRSKKKCNPFCSPNTLYIHNVTFRNGVVHTRQSCRLCKAITYLPRGSSKIDSLPLAAQEQSRIRKEQYGESFYSNPEWLHLRYLAFRKYGKICAVCNSSSSVMHVDHIKPRSKFPELELELSNLQILCEACNLGKSNVDETDWRAK